MPKSPAKVLRFEGHDYEIADQPRPGLTRFVRRAGSDSPVKEGVCATIDITDSGDGWHYLPRRVAPPLGGDPETGVAPHPDRDTIRARPEYRAGRDDLARAGHAKQTQPT